MADTSAHLVIKDLVVAPKSELTKHILDGITLTIKPGEVHAIMGPNGSGKTTLSYALMGHPGYEIISGEVHWKGAEPARLLARSALALRPLLGLPVSNGNPWTLRCELPAHRNERASLGAWCATQSLIRQTQ